MDNQFKNIYDILNDEEKVQGLIIRSCASERWGDYQLAYNLAKQALEKSEELSNETLKLGSYTALAFSRWRGGNFNEFEKYNHAGHTVLDNIISQKVSKLWKYYHATLLHAQSILLFERGDSQKAEQVTYDSLKLRNEIEDDYGLARLYTNLSLTYSFAGNFEKAEEYIKLGIPIYRKLKNLDGLALTLSHLSGIKYIQGDVENSDKIAHEALELFQKGGNLDRLFSMKAGLINRALDKGDFNLANQYYEEMKKISDINEVSSLIFITKWCKGHILMKKNSMRDKVDALRIFEDLLKSEIPPNLPSVPVYLRISICTILIEELEIYGNIDTLDEIKNHIDIIIEDAPPSYLIMPYLETFILKSKLSLVEGDLKEAENILDKGIIIAKDKSLYNFVKRIERERESIVNKITDWETMLKNNSSIKERIEMTKIKEYFEFALKETRRTS